MASAAVPTLRRIPPPRVYGELFDNQRSFARRSMSLVSANIPRRRSTNEARSTVVYENDHDHDKSAESIDRSTEKKKTVFTSPFRCLIEENELREINRRQSIRIEYLERDYRQLDDDLLQIQTERDLLLKQKRLSVERRVSNSIFTFVRLMQIRRRIGKIGASRYGQRRSSRLHSTIRKRLSRSACRSVDARKGKIRIERDDGRSRSSSKTVSIIIVNERIVSSPDEADQRSARRVERDV